MYKKHLAYTQIIVVLIMLQGCTYHYVADPDRYTVGLDRVPVLRINGSIHLINGQPDKSDQIIAWRGGVDYSMSFHQMTDAAIRISKKTLEDRGITVSENASKSLILSIIGLKPTFGFWVVRVVVDLEVEKSDGEKLLFKGDNTTGGSPERGIDGAILKSVASMLNDARIQAYLKQ
jgi:hypothetical protein